jgi:hypothetical protein
MCVKNKGTVSTRMAVLFKCQSTSHSALGSALSFSLSIPTFHILSGLPKGSRKQLHHVTTHKQEGTKQCIHIACCMNAGT